MDRQKRVWTGIAAAVCMLVLILDAKTAFFGAKTGIELCLRTVIPALFPFIVISIVISSNLAGIPMMILRPVGKLCGMPAGSESLLLLGLFGGYPVGAQGVFSAYEGKSINKTDARRLLGFCSNAGPAFIFGMMGSLFQSSVVPWVLWIVHILSAVFVGCILPNKSHSSCKLSQQPAVTLPQALEKGIKTVCGICGWIILFRILIAFLQRWFLWLMPQTLQVCLIAALELSNGCFEVYNVTTQGARFIMCSGILAFGGICVLMQTRSVTGHLGWGMYFPGKILQSVISVLLASAAQHFLFSQDQQCKINSKIYPALLLIGLAILSVRLLRKKVVALSGRMLYNKSNILQA